MAKILKTGWLPRVIDGVKTNVYAWSHAKCCYYGDPDDGVTVEDELKSLNSNLTSSDGTAFRFGVDSDGNYGYIVTDEDGADAVVPFKKGIVKKLVGTVGGSLGQTQSGSFSLNVRNILPEYYSKLTLNNFALNVTYAASRHTYFTDTTPITTWSCSPRISGYNQDTGVLSITGLFGHNGGTENGYYYRETSIQVQVYAFYSE